MIEQWAISTATKIRSLNPEETAPQDVLVFGLTILLNLFFTCTLILLTSLFLGKTMLAIQVTLSFMVLRILTGGAHLDRSLACSLNSLCLILVFLYIPVSSTLMILYAIVSLVLMLRYAPYYEAHQLRHSEQWETKKKRAALGWVLLAVVLYYVGQAPGFLLGSLLQAVLLTPLGISCTHKLNTLTNKGGESVEEGSS